MSPEEIKTRILKAFMEAFDNGNLSALDAICAPDKLAALQQIGAIPA